MMLQDCLEGENEEVVSLYNHSLLKEESPDARELVKSNYLIPFLGR